MKKRNTIFKAMFLLGIFSIATSCCDCPEGEVPIPEEYYNEPATIIPVQQAKEMYDTYSKNKVPFLQQSRTKEQYNIQSQDGANGDGVFNPTRYIQYSIEDLKHYLAYIENESKKANVDITGVRIYLGAYPDDEKFSTGGAIKYPNQESVFMTPIAKFDNKELAYFTRGDVEGGKRFAVPTQGLGQKLMEVKGYNNRKFDQASMLPFLAVVDTTDDRSMTMNRGFVVPPPKTKDDFNDSTDDN